MKVCSKCKIEKNKDDYPKVGNKCKNCISEYKKEYFKLNKKKVSESKKKWREDNKEIISENRKKWREDNKEKIKESSKNYYLNNKEHVNNMSKKYYSVNKERLIPIMSEYYIKYREDNKEKVNDSKKKWLNNNKDYFTSYIKNRSNTDELFRFKLIIRNTISTSFRCKGLRKNSKTSQILGCSFEDFKLYIESKFEFWMAWENYGKYNGELNYGWDIDHIIPISSAKTEDDIIRLNHFSNLQPLCSKINRDIKRDLIT